MLPIVSGDRPIVTGTSAPRFDHPQILLIDQSDAAATVLREAGYNVSTGSFGSPYPVPASDKLLQAVMTGALPSTAGEQEIVVVDLASPPPAAPPARRVQASRRADTWWSSCDAGIIDPRPGFMRISCSDFDRLVAHGGVFVLFADHRFGERLMFGHPEYDFMGREQFVNQEIAADNWSVLSLLSPDDLKVVREAGQDIRATEPSGVRPIDVLTRTVEQYLPGASFWCTVQPRTRRLGNRWVTLATNRFGAAVAGLVIPSEDDEGWVLILPHLDDRPGFLKRLLADVLPELAPRLFPHVEGARWVERAEYELPGVLDLKDRIRGVEEEARGRVVTLEGEIEATRRDLSYLHDLLTAQGQPLVDAVGATLRTLGFRSVIDVDAELAAAGEPDKDEDLRIEDGSPLVLVEVKGVRGTSGDDDALQVAKHIAPRMKKLDRTDIKGLAIINHERHLPALERKLDPFRDLVVTSATEQDVGLMTAWDLYRLTRSFLANGWAHEHVRDLFYRSGRIRPLPDHYVPLGTVEKFRDKIGVVSVRLGEGALGLHDRIAFELPWGFEEHVVESLQIEGVPVDSAPEGSLGGIKTPLTKEKAKPGTRVYKVATSAQTPSAAKAQVSAEDAHQ